MVWNLIENWLILSFANTICFMVKTSTIYLIKFRLPQTYFAFFYHWSDRWIMLHLNRGNLWVHSVIYLINVYLLTVRNWQKCHLPQIGVIELWKTALIFLHHFMRKSNFFTIQKMLTEIFISLKCVAYIKANHLFCMKRVAPKKTSFEVRHFFSKKASFDSVFLVTGHFWIHFRVFV